MTGYRAAGKPTYGPARIEVPTLVIVAKWYQDTPRERQVVLGEGTHSVCLEKSRMQFIQQIQSFLDET